jgi:small GTP-binding protein
VGKSALLARWSGDAFSKDHVATIGVDFRIRHDAVPITADVDADEVVGDAAAGSGKRTLGVKTQLWDTAGQERFRAIVSSYYRGADAIVLAYDLGCRESLAAACGMWHGEARRYATAGAEFVLVGTKLDTLADDTLADGKAGVPRRMSAAARAALSAGAAAAAELGVRHFATSAAEADAAVHAPLLHLIETVARRKEDARLRQHGWVDVKSAVKVQEGGFRQRLRGMCAIL